MASQDRPSSLVGVNTDTLFLHTHILTLGSHLAVQNPHVLTVGASAHLPCQNPRPLKNSTKYLLLGLRIAKPSQQHICLQHGLLRCFKFAIETDSLGGMWLTEHCWSPNWHPSCERATEQDGCLHICATLSTLQLLH